MRILVTCILGCSLSLGTFSVARADYFLVISNWFGPDDPPPSYRVEVDGVPLANGFNVFTDNRRPLPGYLVGNSVIFNKIPTSFKCILPQGMISFVGGLDPNNAFKGSGAPLVRDFSTTMLSYGYSADLPTRANQIRVWMPPSGPGPLDCIAQIVQ